jgi:hypothetical protein
VSPITQGVARISVRPGDESIERHSHVDDNFAHSLSPFSLVITLRLCLAISYPPSLWIRNDMGARMRPSFFVPRRCRSEVRSLGIYRGLGKDFRAAGRAVVHPIGQMPHLWVAALAGVASQGIGQGSYLLEGPEDRTSNREAAGVAAGHQLGSPRPQLPRSARRADDVAWSGCRTRWRFHRGLLRWSPTLCRDLSLWHRSDTSRPLRRRSALCWSWRTRSRVTPSSLLSSTRVAGSRSSSP